MKQKLVCSLLIALCLLMVGCQKQSQNKNEVKDQNPKNENVVISESTTIEDYKEETIQKMKSLGKSVKDKILIISEDSRTQTIYHVLTFENGKNTENYYYYFYLKNTENFDNLSKGYEEVDANALWTKTSVDLLDRTWEKLYKSFSHMRGYTVIE